MPGKITVPPSLGADASGPASEASSPPGASLAGVSLAGAPSRFVLDESLAPDKPASSGSVDAVQPPASAIPTNHITPT